jgi:hypothetical protein
LDDAGATLLVSSLTPQNLPQKPAPDLPRKSVAMNHVLPRSLVFFVVHLLFIGATMALVAYY